MRSACWSSIRADCCHRGLPRRPHNDAPRGEPSSRPTSKNLGENVVRIEAEALRALADRLAGPMAADFERAVELLYGCAGRVVVTGMGKSGLIARKIAATLTSTGSPALFLHPAEALHGDLGMVVRGDVVVALSASGETAEILQLLATVKRLGVPLITMTCDDLHSPSVRRAAQPVHPGASRGRCARLLGRPRSLLAWTCAHGLDHHHARAGRRAGGCALATAWLQGRGLRQPASRRQAGQAIPARLCPDAHRERSAASKTLDRHERRDLRNVAQGLWA